MGRHTEAEDRSLLPGSIRLDPSTTTHLHVRCSFRQPAAPLPRSSQVRRASPAAAGRYHSRSLASSAISINNESPLNPPFSSNAPIARMVLSRNQNSKETCARRSVPLLQPCPSCTSSHESFIWALVLLQIRSSPLKLARRCRGFVAPSGSTAFAVMAGLIFIVCTYGLECVRISSSRGPLRCPAERHVRAIAR